jgi:hypothetical protein
MKCEVDLHVYWKDQCQSGTIPPHLDAAKCAWYTKPFAGCSDATCPALATIARDRRRVCNPDLSKFTTIPDRVGDFAATATGERQGLAGFLFPSKAPSFLANGGIEVSVNGKVKITFKADPDMWKNRCPEKQGDACTATTSIDEFIVESCTGSTTNTDKIVTLASDECYNDNKWSVQKRITPSNDASFPNPTTKDTPAFEIVHELTLTPGPQRQCLRIWAANDLGRSPKASEMHCLPPQAATSLLRRR